MRREPNTDDYWMHRALELAHRAEEEGEVPVGALLVKDAQLLAEGWNRPVSLHDPTAHAEIIVLRKAAHSLKNYRLPGTTLYVTLEPCPMCVGAIIHARIERLVFGTYDSKSGAVESVFKLLPSAKHNHSVDITGGCLQQHCRRVLQSFFQKRRNSHSDRP